ncbi:MBL fold metallo-hydrolase [Microbacterium album]|uniref:MBL fold metallo-hydrolase n=1 Tax=Microbacterium album TaxID=2053191 RepID=A0A917IJ33_9MICO|nr:MBL fold metallo-hydrolase [Microbacterium album]GGH51562.1 MBL fold metallo-hydrolase [Microbacterium album]
MTAEPRLTIVADGVWAYIQPDGGWMINNMGLITGADAATSVDVTSTERRTRDYLRAIAGVTKAPLRRVILTHSHPDHCNGASLVPDAEIVAHRGALEEMRVAHPLAPHIFEHFDQGAARPRLPTMVFDDELTLDPAGRRILVRNPGTHAHTGGDAYVWLPEERVLFAGDLVFNGGTPFALSGSPLGWLRAIEQMAALAPEVVVPGHGDVGGVELLGPVAGYLNMLIDAARDAYDRGLGPLEAARALDLGPYGRLLEPERIAGNLHRVLAELEGVEPDFAAAWQDMYEYNGARPLECRA